jgi:hypothetical protein
VEYVYFSKDIIEEDSSIFFRLKDSIDGPVEQLYFSVTVEEDCSSFLYKKGADGAVFSEPFLPMLRLRVHIFSVRLLFTYHYLCGIGYCS